MHRLPHTQNIVVANIYKVICGLPLAPLEASSLLIHVGEVKLKHFIQCRQVDRITLLTGLNRRFLGGSILTGLLVVEGRGGGPWRRLLVLHFATTLRNNNRSDHVLGKILSVLLQFTLILIKLLARKLGNKLLDIRISLFQLGPTRGDDPRELEEADLAMLLAMLTLRSPSRSKVPVGEELSVFVSFWHIVDEGLALMNRLALVGIFTCHGLNNELTLDLEVDMVGSQGTLRLLRVLSRT